MKKTVKILALAVVALSLTVACKNAPVEEETIDTIDTVTIEETVIDTIVEEAEAVVETTKTTAKKAEEKATGVDASKMTVNTEAGSATVSLKKKGNKQTGVDASEMTLKTENGSATVNTEGTVTLKKKNK